MVAGPTKAGKTVWVKNLVLNATIMIQPPPEEVYWCYMEWQTVYDELMNSGIKFCQGLPEMNNLKANKK